MDLGAFNVFSFLNKSTIRPNFKSLVDGDESWTVPDGVFSVTVIMAGAGGGGADGASAGGGGAAATVIIRDMPVLPGMILKVATWTGAAIAFKPGVGGLAGTGAGSGSDGGSTRLYINDPGYGPTNKVDNRFINAPGGKGGLNTGVGGRGGGTDNTLVAGGGELGGVAGNPGGSVDPEAYFLDNLSDRVIRVQGAGGAGAYGGGAFPDGYGGDNVFAQGGNPTSVGSAGGGASLFGKGGQASAAYSPSGELGSGGASKSSSAAAGPGGNGFCYLFWNGKKA